MTQGSHNSALFHRAEGELHGSFSPNAMHAPMSRNQTSTDAAFTATLIHHSRRVRCFGIDANGTTTVKGGAR